MRTKIPRCKNCDQQCTGRRLQSGPRPPIIRTVPAHGHLHKERHSTASPNCGSNTTNALPGNAPARVPRRTSKRCSVASMQLPSKNLTRYPGSKATVVCPHILDKSFRFARNITHQTLRGCRFKDFGTAIQGDDRGLMFE